MSVMAGVGEADRDQRDNGKQRGGNEKNGGDDLGAARSDPSAEDARDQKADQRQEDDCRVHAPLPLHHVDVLNRD